MLPKISRLVVLFYNCNRDRTIKKFKNGDFNILIATDIAARGIDIANLDLVINYDIPQENEYYVHRIGRTGRNKSTGRAITYVVGKEKNKLREIEKYAKTTIPFGNVPTIAEVNKIKDEEFIKNVQDIMVKGEYIKSKVFDQLLNDESVDLIDLAKAMFTMMNTKQDDKKVVETNYTPNEEGFVRLFFNLGKKDGVRVKDIIGSVSANTAVSGNDIGKVDLYDKFSFVEVSVEFVDEVLTGMKGKPIKGKKVNIEVAK